jgi:predicted Zn-dependent peptidase
MQFMASLSKQTHVDDSGYDSLFLVYQGSYDQALQEAAHIASGAHLTASQEVINAQKLVNQGKQFSGLDTSSLSKGIVYTNYALTAMNIDYLVVVSVDGN